MKKGHLLKMKKYIFSILILLMYSSIYAQISLPKVFCSNMVLQRNIDIPIWGNARAGAEIEVILGNNKTKTFVDSEGKWETHLPKMQAGGPYEMLITENNNSETSIKLANILIGDVWFASGQSNMEMQVQQSKNAEFEIANANYSQIRFFNVLHEKKPNAQNMIAGGKWEVCDTMSVRDKSAVAYFFARKLQTELNIPIGILQSTWGGTPVEAWTSREQLLSCDITRQQVLNNDTISEKHFEKDSLDLIKFWKVVYNPQNSSDKIYPKSNFDDSDWKELSMPSVFNSWDMPFYQGIFWLRKSIELPKSMKGKDLTINLGHPEMNYSLYFNGNEICKTVWNAEPKHIYQIPAKFIKKGRNVISVRMAVLWGGGGFNPPAEEMFLSDGKTKISLTGNWKYKKNLETEIPKINNYHQFPAYLYNAMVNAVIPYGIKGFIWYQGENNAGAAKDYQTLFPLLISDWRIRWQQGYLPFLFVQLANYMKVSQTPTESDWAELREAQTMTLSQANTAMACIIDIGEANDIHPKNKQEVGRRLALLAENMVYGKEVQAYGPVYDSYQVDGDKIIIRFREIGSGLSVRDNEELRGFAIAGEDKVFHWAKAEIKNNQVIVSSDKVKKTIAVRYAWADNPVCNLINKEGLPAIPFRTEKKQTQN